MDTLVCIKRVPETAEVEIKVDSSGRDIIKERLTFDINESDNYAIEEAILLKEKLGGQVTLISLGSAESEDILRMGMAKGADNAIRVDSSEFGELDGAKTAEILKAVISKLHFDIIFTGCMATDDASSQVGPMLAEMLEVPHAVLVTEINVENVGQGFSIAKVHRELEGGLMEVVELKLPAVCAIQTGINEPRYASLIAIRRAAAKEIKVLKKEELGIEEPALKSSVDALFSPPVGKRAEIFSGSPDETSAKATAILKEKGLV